MFQRCTVGKNEAMLLLSLLAGLLLVGCDAAAPSASPTAPPVPSAVRGTTPLPQPSPSAPPSSGTIRYLGVNDVLDLAFAPAPQGGTGGSLWAATTGGAARWDLATDTYVQYTAADGLASNYVTGVAVAPGGSLWFSTGSGVNHFDGSTWMTYTAADGLAAGTPQAVAVTPQGVVWVGTTDGVSRYTPTDGTWTSCLPGVRAWDVDVAPSGDIWFANHGAGVYRYTPADDAWTNYTEAGSQPLQGVTSLAVGPPPPGGTGGAVYAYENWAGVYRFDGEAWAPVPGPDGQPVHGALTVAPAPPGGTGGALWVAGQESLARFDGSALLTTGGQGWTVYPAVEGAQALAVTPDNSLWLGTDNGAVRFQPDDE